MVINTKELLDAVAILADKRAMKTTVQQSCKGALICGAGSLVGGLLMGPPGLAIGGAAGGIVAYKMTSGSFRPVGDIIRNDLTVAQQQMLYEKIVNAVREIEITDAAVLLPLILKNSSIQGAVLNTVASFITNELKLQIVD